MRRLGRLVLRLALAALACLAAIPAQAQTATPWQSGTYVYDGAGNIKSIGASEQFRYDAHGRLVSGTAGGSTRTQSATYDRFGNLLSLTTDGTEVTFGVDPATNRMSRSGTGYNAYGSYDAAGRLEETLGGVADKFVYDDADMISRSTVDGVTRLHLYTNTSSTKQVR